MPPRPMSEPVKTAPQSVYEIDGGRARRGLMVLAACALFWLIVAWLCAHI
jgi:hypothetical protein